MWPFKKTPAVDAEASRVAAEEVMAAMPDTAAVPVPEERKKVAVKKLELKIHLHSGDWFGLMSTIDEEGEGVYDDFIAWVERLRSTKSIQDGFFRLNHRDGYEVIRHSTIRRVSVTRVTHMEYEKQEKKNEEV